jgi:isocitrate dehydrogenase kinase/phosphatase
MSPRPNSRPTDSRLAVLGARLIAAAFSDYRRRFRTITQQAQTRFATRAWAQLRADAKARLALYRLVVGETETALRALLTARVEDTLVWISLKAVYSGLITERHDWDLAETFFNSITRRVFTTVGVDPQVEFVDTDFADAPPISCSLDTRRYPFGAGNTPPCDRLLADLDFGPQRWRDQAADLARLKSRIAKHLAKCGVEPISAEFLAPTFYRGKGAYLIGRLHLSDDRLLPCVIALRNGPEGLFVDAVLLTEADVSILFSFTRSYFLVDTPRPHDVVRFLASVLPRKRPGELYISLGEPKQGKTELYRGLLHQLLDQDERFMAAPGTPGLVMVVFTLPSYNMVLKVIRDNFPPQKLLSPAAVRERYHWVYNHDRAGRLIDAQSFEHLVFDRAAFEPELLAELLTECGRTVKLEGDTVTVALAYLERRVTPLNLYIRQAEPEAVQAALLEFGNALRDLAACNIFAGDLLLKNFGVTRHGRVAFYDYDELVALDTVKFRRIPPARTPEQEMSATPWYRVAENDVFPEEFPRFLGLNADQHKQLNAEHADLFDAAWWRSVQAQIRAGKVMEFTPYPPSRRL